MYFGEIEIISDAKGKSLKQFFDEDSEVVQNKLFSELLSLEVRAKEAIQVIKNLKSHVVPIIDKDENENLSYSCKNWNGEASFLVKILKIEI